MKVVFWIGGISFVLTAIPCVIFFAAYLSTGETVPKERALKFYRWAALAVLSTFNIWIFKRVFDGVMALFGH
jgi:hypothetical protein